MNKRISLNGSDWQFKKFYGEDWRWRNSHMPDSRDLRGWRVGSVPGCPDHELWQLGEIPDPYIERNSLLCEWISQRTWLYKKTFIVDGDVKGQHNWLHFGGVDYQAEFFLNGESLGSHTGMFTPASFDVADKLRYAEREAEVVRSAANISDGLRIGKDVIFHSPNTPRALETANRAGEAHSVSKTEVSRLASEALAEVTARTIQG